MDMVDENEISYTYARVRIKKGTQIKFNIWFVNTRTIKIA